MVFVNAVFIALFLSTAWMLVGAFAKLRKATISLVTSVYASVHPSVRMEKLGSRWTELD
jgi:hypothetical protein